MSFLPEKPFNPQVSKIANLGPSSGDPKSYKDPKSVASIGAKIQAMTDQISADTLYDEKKEGFCGSYMKSDPTRNLYIISGILGIALIIGSFYPSR